MLTALEGVRRQAEFFHRTSTSAASAATSSSGSTATVADEEMRTTRNLAADPRAAAAAAAGRAAARVQHVAVGATHPAAAVALYERRLSGAKQMMVGGVHTVPAQLEQRFAGGVPTAQSRPIPHQWCPHPPSLSGS